MNITLRPWQLTDAAALAAILSNRNVQDNLRDGLPFPYTEKDGGEFIAAMLAADPASTFAFAVLADGELAGSIGASRQGNIHARTAELGYYIGENFWGRGICTEAVRLICRHIFENTDILRISAQTFATNAASGRVLEKAGFTREGTLRANAVKNGIVLDMEMYALIAAHPA